MGRQCDIEERTLGQELGGSGIALGSTPIQQCDLDKTYNFFGPYLLIYKNRPLLESPLELLIKSLEDAHSRSFMNSYPGIVS